MKMTGQLNGLGRNLRHESMTQAAQSSQTQRLHVDDLMVCWPAAFLKISLDEESL